MAITILHTGQTGVERGAYRAARAVNFAVAGFCPRGGRDELGMIPAEIRRDLNELTNPGARAAAYTTLQLANAVVISVPERREPNSFPAVEALRRAIRTRKLPCFVIDAAADFQGLGAELRAVEARLEHMHLMVTGLRRTRWVDGERVGWQVVSELALTDPLKGPRKRRVLVVEGDLATANGLGGLLRVLGHECRVVADGRSALECAAELDPDIVLLNIRLPDIDGYEVAQRLRSAQRRPLFLAAITGWEGASDPVLANEAGFDRHIRKPAPPEVIQSLLDDADAHLTAAARDATVAPTTS